MKKTIVIIPAYNEEQTIGEIIRRSFPFADVCVVNDGSEDKTAEIVKTFRNVKLINHEKNTHIPQATLDGMKYAYEKKYDYIITMDAGLSHIPEELKRFIKAPHSDMIIGTRNKEENKPLYRKFLSFMGTFLINRSLRHFDRRLKPAKFKDLTSGFRRYSRRAVRLLLSKRFKAKTFDFHSEALMFVYRNGMKITEVPITYNFTNSSLNIKVVMDCVKMYFNFLVSGRK